MYRMTEYTHANLIVSRLWLGNRKAAADGDFLGKNNITAVFNCTKTLPFHDSVLRKYRLPVDDNLEAAEIKNMESWAPEAVYKVIAEYNRGETILIHCHAGMQRSAALMAMVLITMTQKPVDDVMRHIRAKRPVAFFPEANFDEAIRGYDVLLRKELH